MVKYFSILHRFILHSSLTNHSFSGLVAFTGGLRLGRVVLLDGTLVAFGNGSRALGRHRVLGTASSFGVLALDIRVRGRKLAVDDRDLMRVLETRLGFPASFELDLTIGAEGRDEIFGENVAMLVAVFNTGLRAGELK